MVSVVITAMLCLGVAILFLITLSLMREIVLLRGEVAGLTQVITIPPTPAIVGQRLPQEILSTIMASSLAHGEAHGHTHHAVIFLSPGCGGCESLVEELDSALADTLITPEDLTAVVTTSPHGRVPESPLRAHNVTVIADRDRRLFKACDVRGTPMIVIIDTNLGKVIDYSFGGDVRWIIESIQPQVSGNKS